MIKTTYQKELLISNSCARGSAGNNKNDVKKIQSWLNLAALKNPNAGVAVSIDGDYGQATEAAVKTWQQHKGLNPSGAVDLATFQVLSKALADAFTGPLSGNGLRERILEAANLHLKSQPYELIINKQGNSGPWVRSYMDGNEGKDWLWCMGFVQSIIDQAASSLDKDFRTLMPLTYSCDTVAIRGINRKLLITSKELRVNPSQVKPGDIFLLPKSKLDWYHTGLVVGVGSETFETVEGNTNNDGSSNGNGVYRRIRNFRKSAIDVFSIRPLVE